MSAVSETIVREYFELHGFLVRQDRKFLSRGREADDGIDFFVWNPQPRRRESGVPFVLASEDLPAILQAVVVVRGWHTETFTPGTLENSPEIFRFVESKVFDLATGAFGRENPPLKILIVPSLPTGELRQQSIQLLKSKGIDAVIPFQTLLTDLVACAEINRNYDKSDLLQIICVLKNYGFLKGSQMELSLEAPVKKKKKPETVPVPSAAAPSGSTAGSPAATEIA